MAKFRTKWTDVKFKDYASEEEWINAYPDDPCAGCGKPATTKGVICIKCESEGVL